MAASSSSSSLAAQNKSALEHFVQTPVTREMVSYLAIKASEIIRCEPPAAAAPASQQGSLPTPPTTPPHAAAASADPTLPPIEEFISSIIHQSHVQVPTLMPALIYLARLKAKLPPVAQGIPSTVHRIFLAALILSAKNLNDSSPKNKHWARYTTVPGYPSFGFTNTEVNLMEKQLLYLLDWNLNITADDLYFHLEPFLAPIRVKLAQRAERKLQAMLREREQQAILQQRHVRQQSISQLACPSQINLPHIIQQARQQSLTRGLYDSPSTYASTSSTTDSPSTQYYRSRSESLVPPSLTHSRSSSQGPAGRTPSLSPPTRCDSSASYNDSEVSTPASAMDASADSDRTNAYPIKPAQAKVAAAPHVYNNMDMGYGDASSDDYTYSYMSLDIPEIMHIQPPQLQKPLPNPGMILPSQTDKPLPQPTARRLRSAGNLLSRWIGGGANTQQNVVA